MVAGIAMRRLRTKAARAALARAERAARHARIPALAAEVENAFLVLNTPAARLIAGGGERLLLLEEVEALLASKAFVVDACRDVVRDAGKLVSLARRPVLFALALGGLQELELFALFVEHFHVQIAVGLDPVLVDFDPKSPNKPQGALLIGKDADDMGCGA